MREVAAVRQVEAHEGVAGLQAGEEDGHVGLGARVGLYVGVLGAVELADALDGQALDLVHHLATAVVAGCGIALGVFVGQYGAHGLHHLVAHEVLGGDQLDTVRLTRALVGDQIENAGVSFHKICYGLTISVSSCTRLVSSSGRGISCRTSPTPRATHCVMTIARGGMPVT